MKAKTLVLCPLKKEWQLTEKSLQGEKISYEKHQDRGRWYLWVPQWQAAICVGGHGKSQFALQAQYWIDFLQTIEKVITIGAAGSLDPTLSVGQVLSVEEILEHDHKSGFATDQGPPLFQTNNKEKSLEDVEVQCGRLASGDEDIVSRERAIGLALSTQARAVAWESAGGARAAQFNQLPYFEYRGITDQACSEAAHDFSKNLPAAMERLVITLKAFFNTP